jgi:uncharacterized damage-inducible protein DinB
MIKTTKPEFWLRGPVPAIPVLLQPVAHALLQAREETRQLMEGFPDELLWDRPWGVASVGFHLQHLAGVLDRLLTYARGEALSETQLAALGKEGTPEKQELDPMGKKGPEEPAVKKLVLRFAEQVDRALEQLSGTTESSLGEARGVGRARLPSTVLGLLVHAAEHTQRHTGQLLVTTRILRSIS